MAKRREHMKIKAGFSPNEESVIATWSRTAAPPDSRAPDLMNPGGPKEFLKKLIDSEAFNAKLQSWLEERLSIHKNGCADIGAPFQLDELRQFDFALEGVLFQQLCRMPCIHPASLAASSEADICLPVEDFLHASAKGLWETFWGVDIPFPFFVTGSHGFGNTAHRKNNPSRKFKGPHCAALVGKNSGAYAPWEHISEFVLLKADLVSPVMLNGLLPNPAVVGQAILYALHMLVSRKMAQSNSAVCMSSDTAYILLVNSQCGSVVRVKGNITELNTNTTKVYESAVAWVQEHAELAVSTVDQVWNHFGNANWGDLGALQLLLATFYCIEQCAGSSNKSITELAADHNTRLQQRRIERRFLEVNEVGSDSVTRQSHRDASEIEEATEPEIVQELERMKLESGNILWLEDLQWQRGFKIHEDLGDGRHFIYSATGLDEASKLLNVYVGAHPSQLEPSWEDMSTWYLVQRQTRVLNLMKQRGVFNKYVPDLVASGRVLHPGSCKKQSPGGRCDHPWCGTPILVTFPIGESLSVIVKRDGVFTPEEALRCCHDCLSALRSARLAGIQHGDLTPEHVLRVMGGQGESYYVLVGWGHAVLEDRDSPAVSLRFSSTYALQEGKLCPSSDSESLIYVFYFLCGGKSPQFDSIESALQWRERSWSRRAIQFQLGEVSAF